MAEPVDSTPTAEQFKEWKTLCQVSSIAAEHSPLGLAGAAHADRSSGGTYFKYITQAEHKPIDDSSRVL